MKTKDICSQANLQPLLAKRCADTYPIEFVLEVLANKWSVPIVRELFEGARRTHQLLEALPGISSKTLTARLRELEAHGLVTRAVYAEIPPRVEYSLTEKGRELQGPIAVLQQLGERWLVDS
ncbi:MAG: winged helix-turn-helix transcriptional regulator [Microcoleus sp.]